MSLRKSAPVSAPHAEFTSSGWTWKVLKTYKAPNSEQRDIYARWFCHVSSPMCPDGELGDVYVSDIVGTARIMRSTKEFADAYAGPNFGIRGVALITEAA